MGSFGDWILALRHLTFYFEDRRALIWDPSAQRQLLRLLFLPAEEAAEYTRREREILELDSEVRNRQYVLRKDESEIANAEGALKTADEARQQLKILQHIQENEQTRLEALNDELLIVNAQRQAARVDALTAEQSHESAVRNLERLELRGIEAAFPNATEVGKYIIGQILAEDKCLTCGSDVPEFAREIRDRIQRKMCPICGSVIGEDAQQHRSSAKRARSQVLKEVEALQSQVAAASEHRESTENAYDDLLNQITVLNGKTSNRTAEIYELIRSLPPDEQEIQM